MFIAVSDYINNCKLRISRKEEREEERKEERTRNLKEERKEESKEKRKEGKKEFNELFPTFILIMPFLSSPTIPSSFE